LSGNPVQIGTIQSLINYKVKIFSEMLQVPNTGWETPIVR